MTDAQIFELPAQSFAPPAVPLLSDIIGDVLRHARRDQQRTLKNVADAAHVSIPYLSEVERGLKEASSEVLSAVCRSLGISILDLIARAHRQVWDLESTRHVRQIGSGTSKTSTSAAPTSALGSVRLLAG